MVFNLGVVAVDSNNFKNFNWGMSQTQVQEQSSNLTELENRSGLLVYSTELQGKEFSLAYNFKDDKLYKTTYTFMKVLSNNKDYITLYNNIKDLLIEKYGEPSPESRGMYWFDDYYRNNPGDWGTALVLGSLAFNHKWETDKSIITMNMRGGDVGLIITYDSKDYADLSKK